MDVEKSNASPRKAGSRETGAAADPPSSPSYLQKQLSQKTNCLCSPTTHAGSFRCRQHRGSVRRNSNSFNMLSELAGKEASDNTN
ncbi:hypothetical protein KSP39_PZI018643 [Platanthera zijinensis]|uniref:Uncharacterized protein n=1 Tax=Platanthera zijinensis TaxID=2320716 RepID=A0AAP0B2N1_9ASPA